MIINPAGPDCHTTDIVTYVAQNISNALSTLTFVNRAVQYGFYDRVVELVDAEPNLANAPLNDGITLLHWAAINNRTDVARYLIGKGAKVDAIGGAIQSSPLHWAVREGKLDMVVLLLSYEAQAGLVDGEGKGTSLPYDTSHPSFD